MSAHFPFPLSALTTAILAALTSGLVHADMPTPEELRHDLATPDSRIEAGIGIISGDSQRFGQFRGIDGDGVYGLLDLDLIKRDDPSGTWFKLKGSNLGLDNRALRLDHERQGDWAYFLEAGQLTRREPWQVNTGLTGIGSSQQTINGSPKRDVDLKIEHDTLALGVRKFMLGGIDVRLSLKQDEKHGERIYGRGTPGTMEFLSEPLDSITRQWDIVAGYADRKLQLSGGYSGSSFENRNPLLEVSGGSAALDKSAAAGGIQQLALPPSNSAHQFHLAGGYNFTDRTRSSFKVSHTRAYQDDNFSPANPVSSSLDARMVSTLAFADLTLRPADRLDVTANLRYEDRDDQTPVQKFLTTANPSAPPALFTAGVTGYNIPRSLQQWKGLLEAGYRLADDYRLVASIEQEQVSRNIPVEFRRIGYRESTDETQLRLAIRHNLAETINGSLAYIHSVRGGSDYVNDTYNASAATPTNQINPLLWADRQRNKLRLTTDWMPAENWSVQFLGDLSEDQYGGRALGSRQGRALFVSADASYAINNKWKLSGWVSQEQITAEQTTHTDYNSAENKNKGVLWEARIGNVTTTYGIALNGKPQENLQISADLSTSTDTAKHNMERLGIAGISSTPGYGTSDPESLPAYFYRQFSFKLSVDYAIQRHSGIRSILVYDHRRTNDWTWAGFTYTDGTTVSQADTQNTSYLGLSYYYRWR